MVSIFSNDNRRPFRQKEVTMNKNKRVLSLRAETIRQLSGIELSHVVGAADTAVPDQCPTGNTCFGCATPACSVPCGGGTVICTVDGPGCTVRAP